MNFLDSCAKSFATYFGLVWAIALVCILIMVIDYLFFS